MSVGGVPRQSLWPLEDSQMHQESPWVHPELRAEQGVLLTSKPSSFPAQAGALCPISLKLWPCLLPFLGL